MPLVRVLREVPAWEVALWRAKEAIDGPIGVLGDNCRAQWMPPQSKPRQSKAEMKREFAMAVQLFNRASEAK